MKQEWVKDGMSINKRNVRIFHVKENYIYEYCRSKGSVNPRQHNYIFP